MRPRLKPLRQQAIVLTGATSGIGLATARMAAARGASLVLVARNEGELDHLVKELSGKGETAVHVAADVSQESEVERIAQAAKDAFGRIDSWINGASVAIYGRLEEVTTEDHRRLFDTNYWGVVYGSRVAVREMRERGGALINVGSVLSDFPMPLQGPYVAAKHALKGFTDTLRMELDKERVPISVTLIKPSAIDTPYMEHARNYLPNAPKNPPPVYAPEIAARAILHACEHPRREIYIGGGGRVMAAIASALPAFFDTMSEATMFNAQQTDRPADSPSDRRDNLYEARDDGAERAATGEGHTRETSLYTEMQLRPSIPAAMAAVAAVAALSLLPRRRR